MGAFCGKMLLSDIYIESGSNENFIYVEGM